MTAALSRDEIGRLGALDPTTDHDEGARAAVLAEMAAAPPDPAETARRERYAATTRVIAAAEAQRWPSPAAAWTPSPNGMTVLRAAGCCVAKRITQAGAATPTMPFRLDAAEIGVDDLAHLGRRLRALAPRRDCFAVRGGLIAAPRATAIRRLRYRDQKTGDAATFADVPRQWLALDVDGLPRPDGLDPRDLAGCAAATRSALPRECHAAALLFRPSSSHAVKPGIRGHAWIWLSRALTCADARRWLAAAAHVDPALFNPVQPIYTADPIFAGVRDPLRDRHAVHLAGDAAVTVPELAEPPAPQPIAPAEGAGKARTAEDLAEIVERELVGLARAQPGAQNTTLFRAAFTLGRFAAAGHLDRAVLAADLLALACRIGHPAPRAAGTIGNAFRAAGAA